MNKNVTKKAVALAIAGVVAVSVLTGCTPPSGTGTDVTAADPAAELAKQAHKIADLPSGKYYAYGDTSKPYFEVADGKMTLNGFTPALHEEILLGIYELEEKQFEQLDKDDDKTSVNRATIFGVGEDEAKDPANVQKKLRDMYEAFTKAHTFTYNVWDSSVTSKFIAAGERAKDGEVYPGSDSGLINLVEADDAHGYTFVVRFGEEDAHFYNLAIPFKLTEANDSLVYNPATDKEDIDLLSADTKALPHAKSDVPPEEGKEATKFPADIPVTPSKDIHDFIAAGKKDMHTPDATDATATDATATDATATDATATDATATDATATDATAADATAADTTAA